MIEWTDATGDVVRGDVVRFTEAVFSGSFRSPKYAGNRTIVAEILRESYGAGKQQHTFTFRVVESSGVQPLVAGVETRRKGRNLYRNGIERQLWTDEAVRAQIAGEKHLRGSVAHQVRTVRRSCSAIY